MYFNDIYLHPESVCEMQCRFCLSAISQNNTQNRLSWQLRRSDNVIVIKLDCAVIDDI